jgi:hypothetical protein
MEESEYEQSLSKFNGNIITWICGEMKDELKNHLSTSNYMCDLGFEIFEDANVNGTYTFSAYKAKEWIKNFWDDIGTYVDYDKQYNDGVVNANPFTNPEAFMVQIMLEISSLLIGQIPLSKEKWNEEVSLDKPTIDLIGSQLDEIVKDKTIDELL